MSAPKETPRQKMIGMMYLVLTAMLALNVSTEVLKSFITVNDAMEKTNKDYTERNEGLYAVFQRAYAANEAKVADQWNKAQQVRTRTAELYDFIQQTKYELIAKTEGVSIEEAKTLHPNDFSKQDNYDIPTNFFMGSEILKDGRAYVLHDKIDEYVSFLQNILGNDTSKVSLKALDVNEDYRDASGTPLSWEAFNFSHTIIVADLALLNRLQTTIRNTESDVVSQLYSSVSEDDFKFDTISARVVPTTSNIVVGTDFEADIFVAAFDSRSKITATINGEKYEGESGSIRYRIPATSAGEKVLRGTIDVPGTFGVKSYPFEYTYHVNQPIATVSADAMNVFYLGIKNPVSAMAAGVADKDIRVTISEGTLEKTGPGQYTALVKNVNVDKTKTVEIKVYARNGQGEKLMGSKQFRLKRVPDPVASIHGKESGLKEIRKNELLVAGGLDVEMKDFDFDVPDLKIVSFKVRLAQNGSLSSSMPSKGDKFSSEIVQMLQQSRRGNLVMFSDIVAQMPDGPRTLGDFTVSIE